jgi:hypothetical protein
VFQHTKNGRTVVRVAFENLLKQASDAFRLTHG